MHLNFFFIENFGSFKMKGDEFHNEMNELGR